MPQSPLSLYRLYACGTVVCRYNYQIYQVSRQTRHVVQYRIIIQWQKCTSFCQNSVSLRTSDSVRSPLKSSGVPIIFGRWCVACSGVARNLQVWG